MSTADAVDREVTFLTASGDGLPALQSSANPPGPWNIIQAYWPRTPATRQSGLYVLRPQLADDRWTNQRKLAQYDFRIRAIWPIGGTTTSSGIGEQEQRALDAAIDLLIQRIRGTLGDHSHGGQFMSVAEAPAPERITVRFDDPETTMAASSTLRAEITYSAHDQAVI